MTVTSEAPGVHTPPVPDRPYAGRHPWLDRLCGWLGAMAVGVAAKEALDAGDLPELGAVVALPTWSWVLPGTDVGRKAFGYDQERLRLPVRLSWSCGPVIVHRAGDDDLLEWHGSGVGRTGQGRMRLGETAHAVLAENLPGWDDELPEAAQVACAPASMLRAELQRLVAAGEQARWDLMLYLEQKYIGHEMTKAAARVVAEISNGEESGLDELTIETLVARFVYGDPDQVGPSKLGRLLEHALSPTQYCRVDPGRWLTVNLRRDAERFIRSYLGDPGVGPKVRRLARELGSGSLDDLVVAYQERHPQDRVAHHRARSALAINPGPLLAGRRLDPERQGEVAS